jgi:secondary thiamine-phosphate synthase enzyme
MKVEKHDIIVETQEQFQIIDITSIVEKILSSAITENGILSFWVPHTTACISINENDPELWMDILQSFKKLVPVKCD